MDALDDGPGEDETRIVPVATEVVAAPARPVVTSTFTLETAMLIPGMKHILDNISQEFMSKLHYYSAFNDTRSNCVCSRGADRNYIQSDSD